MAEALKQVREQRPSVENWGVDLKTHPGVPKERPSSVTDAYGPPLPRQKPKIDVTVSVEHRGLTPAFGESVAPKGLSGLLRRYAYQFGEGRNARWMTLILADRVDAVEESLRDLTRGILPNPYKERGWSADLRYDRLALAKRSAIYVGIGIAGVFLVRRMLRARGDLA